MAGYNRIIMIGNLTRDPEYRQLPSGQAVCRLGMASNRQFKSKQTGSMVQEVCFVDIDVWGAQAESCHQYLQKGRPILIEGRLKFDSWEDQSGQRRTKHSIVADRVVFLSSSQSTEDQDGTSQFDQRAPKNDVEKELMDQLNQIKNKVKAPDKEAEPKKQKAATRVKQEEQNKDILDVPQEAKSKKTGEIDFKDEPPFEDDLPF
ncbi:single-stranded DNA-binding protein [bacterium]|jgi:single-strand DNA-binding protein|nr:single-stranded DNA-binding protein [bacterium]